MLGGTTFSSATGTFVGGGGTVEPAFDDVTGGTVFILTPTKAKVKPNEHNVAPLYLPVYPLGNGMDPAAFDCQHWPADRWRGDSRTPRPPATD